jgi:phage head maturation protease
MGEQLRHYQAPTPLIARADVEAREVDVRLLEWGVPADVGAGQLEEFAAGTRIHSNGVDVDQAQIVARADHADPPIGRVAKLWSAKDGPYATLAIAKTRAGDDALELARDGIYVGPSVGFMPAEPSSYRKGPNGESIAVRTEMDLREVSLTWRPAHKSAAIIAVRSEGQPMDQNPTPASPPANDVATTLAAIEALGARFDALEERSRRDVDVPSAKPTDRGVPVQQWLSAALSQLAGDRVPELELRALADVVTADNLGVVPKQIRSELLGLIDPARPFLASTRQVDAGSAGMTMTFPRIVQRPLVGKQTAEKAELPSRKSIIDTVDFTVETYGGAGDLSLQMLKRSSPAFLQLWLDLLAEAYAMETDDAAVDALLAAGVIAGTGTFDPAAPAFTESWTNAMAVSRLLKPDRIWLSSAAMAAFIDAKTPAGGGGQPMYPGMFRIGSIQAAGSGTGGPSPITLDPVHVPALDDEAVDVIIGPSRGFAWAEDGTYQLQADVPAKAGRDVGLAGMVWFMPVYAGAFTTYALGA